MIELKHGDCLEVLRTMPDNSVDSIVTDPPYGLAFMGKKWDYDVPSEDIWRECLRVLKPGGYLLAFAGTRTQHRMAVRIEDAGFEIRDMIAWVYGSGFPKSLDVSKAIDRAAGAERNVIGTKAVTSNFDDHNGSMMSVSNSGGSNRAHVVDITAPATPAARQWQGWGTALKPALEPITVARKPFPGTVADNVQEWGAGGINVDGCRVGTDEVKTIAPYLYRGNNGNSMGAASERLRTNGGGTESQLGRWPANLIHDGSDEVTGLFQGEDTGSAARFFYCAKASKKDRDEGCEGFEAMKSRNHHPTVKPTDLMRYLCRLVTPPNGVVLDPFMGSGSTGKAAVLERFSFIGIDRESEYVEIARCRIAAAEKEIAQKLPL